MSQLKPFAAGPKTLALLLALTSTALPARAKCINSGLRVWPQTRTVHAAPVFVVDGYSASQEIIRGLGTTYKIYLQAADQQIPLEVQQLLPGEFAVTQAVLKPRRSLEVGRQYELVITEARKKGTAKQNLVFQLHRSRVLYTVVPGQDQTPPEWLARPTKKGQQYTEYGCGPDVFVDFTCQVRDESEYMVKATVKSLSSGQQTTYYVAPDKQGILFIGRGMCSGPFMLDKGPDYSVTFALLDASGNTTPWAYPPLQFTQPQPNNQALRQPELHLPGE
ncbi:hypothetical protein [Hymenobacter cellulosilyticus]|uniref:DUF4165 domain-containing protein n=1 Tax=Hymenobacter cellulosilyticus TaxID=2932248 RepID=A0A8T9PZ89_9BACT|nr:hypothetical protein [Hymenobacter cellulosilyticus]UOQ70544.1 hypothetical protein MUN79_17705 [Hymenobacter cellulosilyticus]